MTEQARLMGDRPIALDDSIAFSAYTEAIDRISHQYSLWEEAQDEFRKYQEMYQYSGQFLERSLKPAFSR